MAEPFVVAIIIGGVALGLALGLMLRVGFLASEVSNLSDKLDSQGSTLASLESKYYRLQKHVETVRELTEKVVNEECEETIEDLVQTVRELSA